jgi:hypothetical protein
MNVLQPVKTLRPCISTAGEKDAAVVGDGELPADLPAETSVPWPAPQEGRQAGASVPWPAPQEGRQTGAAAKAGAEMPGLLLCFSMSLIKKLFPLDFLPSSIGYL